MDQGPTGASATGDRTDEPVQVRRLENPAALRRRLDELGVQLPVAEQPSVDGALSRPLEPAGMRSAANRWCILPMEGWDATGDGRPTDLVRRRWRRFGESGAGLIWGGEAVAVVPEGRANPNQLCIGAESGRDLAELRRVVLEGWRSGGGAEEDRPLIGLQLTHSGRWARPDGSPRPRTARRNPVLDPRVGADASSVISDTELEELVGHFVAAAALAAEAGFDFVDVKQCHGYLAHELLGAVDRPGHYGGDLAGRTRWVTSVLEAITSEVPAIGLGSRISFYDLVPHVAGPDGRGVPDTTDGGEVPFCFGGDGTGLGVDLTETHALVDLLAAQGVALICATAGSPYYVPHAQRPAFFPPSDGYRPPGDPLVEVARMASATREVTTAHPEVSVVGSGLTYLQDHLPNVAEGLVAEGWMDSAGIGRMALSLPTLPADSLAGRTPERRFVCRTFSDCTTAPRNGLVSGCYPLDDFYKQRPERVQLAALKKAARDSLRGERAEVGDHDG